jgi:hypothetical protein
MRRIALTLVVVVVVVAGCDVGPALVPVSGTVVSNGKPVADLNVIYAPEPSTQNLQTAEAKTGPDGRYKLATGGKWGIAPGKYRVSVSSGANPMRAKVGDSLSLEAELHREVPPMGAKFDLDVTPKDLPPSF